MDQEKIEQLRVMIAQADFLNAAIKKLFLDKLPYLDEKKITDLYKIFEHDQEERNKLNQKKVKIFERYKATVTGIYQKAKQVVIGLKEKAFTKLDESELKNLDQELKNL